MWIDNYIKTLINTIEAKLYTVGTEPIGGGWDTIENQNKLLYDRISQLNPFIEYDYKVEYHTAWEYYPYPAGGWRQPSGFSTWYYPVNILNTDKPCVVLYDFTADIGYDIILWSPLGGQIKVDNYRSHFFQKDNYQFIGTYFDNYLKLVFMNLHPSSEPKTVERSYTANGTYVSETEIDGWVFNTLPVVRWTRTGIEGRSSYWEYFIEAPITVSLQNYFPPHEHFVEFLRKKTTLVKTDTGWYIGFGGIGIFVENEIKKIIFLQNPLLMGSNEIIGNTLCNDEVWGYTQWGVLRFKC